MNAYDEGYGAGQEEAKEYIHQLEGWLAEVRERSASLLEERNEIRKAMRTLGNDYNALSAEHAKWQEEARSYCQNASYHRQKREQAEAEVSRLQVHEDESAERLERLTEAEAEVERLKVCGNCASLKWANADCPDDEQFEFCGQTEERSTERLDIWSGDRCHFTPSRWAERGAKP